MDDGTRYDAYGVIGLGIGRDIGIYCGHDETLDSPGDEYRMPLRHRVEIAEYMIAAWNRYRELLGDEMIERAESPKT
jgi:hypothetical protein